MKRFILLLIFGLGLLAQPTAGLAQRILFSGQITEAATGQPVPFASVFVKGSSVGTTADDQGRYQLSVPQPIDSLSASAMGYRAKSRAVGGRFSKPST
ncbi:carboxypeptidase-like regulatory domain-containing protein [Hymenobacter cellulosilyticus]|uniref:Carboxypeptidase-like regulatory domain-containing protein n=1 Tax=Hymenobacter cellulosilyticus TaxID=2932248 RepID=A0A8T9Q8J6_9BACT|nr:carboxypeptidase-like regulatory domain-containing protein [Hymenobacter cellulosilyticus]UOQ71849.1 carboxypeptidase-like regulatory domain-containing protein [Hymenobacter cellulosilyticus]